MRVVKAKLRHGRRQFGALMGCVCVGGGGVLEASREHADALGSIWAVEGNKGTI